MSEVNEQSFLGQVAHGLAQAVGQLYEEGYEDALEHTGDKERAHDAGLKNVPAAALEYLGDKLVVGKILKPLVGKVTVGQVLKAAGASAASEGLTEGAQQMWQNAVAKWLSGYDPDRKLDQEVLHAAILGATVGGIAGGGGVAAKGVLQGGVFDPSIGRTPDGRASETELGEGERLANAGGVADPSLMRADDVGTSRVERLNAAMAKQLEQIDGTKRSSTDSLGGELAGSPSDVGTPSAPDGPLDLEALLARAGEHSQGARAAIEAEQRARAERLEEAKRRREQFDEYLAQARELAAAENPKPAAVKGVVTTLRAYTEDKAVGLGEDQLSKAYELLRELTPRYEAIITAEQEAGQERLAAAKEQAEAEAAERKVRIREERRAIRADDKQRLENLSDDELAKRAQEGDEAAWRELERRAQDSGPGFTDEEDLLTVLRRIKLPTRDSGLQAELDGLRKEGMSFGTAQQLFDAKKSSLDKTAEALREDYGFHQIQTPDDVLGYAQRAIAGERILPQPRVDFAREGAKAGGQPDTHNEQRLESDPTADRPDPFTGERSFITGSRVTADEAKGIARRARERLAAVPEPDAGGAQGVAAAQLRDGQKILPLARSPDGASVINTRTGQALPQIGRGVEAYVYEDAAQGVVYKVYETGSSSDQSIGMRLAIDEGMVGLDTGQFPDIIEKTWAINELGGTPTEIVGLTEDGEIVVKQPRGNDAARWARAQVIAKARLQEIPAEVLGRIDPRSPVYYAQIEGQDVLLGDLHARNLIGDTIGEGRINDLATHVLTEEELRTVPRLAEWIESRRGQAQARGAAEFAKGGDRPLADTSSPEAALKADTATLRGVADPSSLRGVDAASSAGSSTPLPSAGDSGAVLPEADFRARVQRIAPGLMLQYRALVGDPQMLIELGVKPEDLEGGEQAAHLARGRERILWFLQRNLRADKDGLMDERLRRDVLHEAAHAWLNTLPADRRAQLRDLWRRDVEAGDGWLAKVQKEGAALREGVREDWAEYWAERLAWENNRWAQARESWGLAGDRGLVAQVAAELRQFLEEAIELLRRAFTRTKRYNIDFRDFLVDTRFGEPRQAGAQAKKHPATIRAESIPSTPNPNVQDDGGNALAVVERPAKVKESGESPVARDIEAGKPLRAAARVLGGQAAWSRGRNAGDTRLGYQDWVKAHSEPFKKWFGDWEAVRGVKQLESQGPLVLDGVEELADNKAMRRKFHEFGEVANELDGRRVKFPSRMAGKIARDKGLSPLRVAAGFDRLFRAAVPMYSEELKPKEKDQSGLAGYHHYVAKLRFEGGDYYVRFTVHEQRASGVERAGGQSTMHSSFISEVRIYSSSAVGTSSDALPVLTKAQTESSAMAEPRYDSKLGAWLEAGKSEIDEEKLIAETGEPKAVVLSEWAASKVAQTEKWRAKYPDWWRGVEREVDEISSHLEFLKEMQGGTGLGKTTYQLGVVDRVYGGRGAYDAAAAAGRTKLGYWQWLQVRTPEFKEWFGDWEGLRAQKRLDAMQPVSVPIPDKWRGLPVEQLRKEALEKLRGLVGDKRKGEGFTDIEHPELGTIRVDGRGVRKTKHASADPAKLLVAAHVDKILPEAIYSRSEPPEEGSNKPNTEGVSKLLARVEVDGLELVAIFTVLREPDGSWYYNTVVVHDLKSAEGEAGGLTTEYNQQSAEKRAAPLSSLREHHRKPLRRVNPETVSQAVDPETGEPVVVYHGTQRPDRVGTVFSAERATSGPMAFFTDNAEVASGYAQTKSDTSIGGASAYSEWFKFDVGGGQEVLLEQAWGSLSAQEQAVILERMENIGVDEDSGDPIYDPSGEHRLVDSGEYARVLRQKRGNALSVLVELWLNHGNLYDREEQFVEVLRLAGVDSKRVRMDSPWARHDAVYAVHLSVRNPLDTAAIGPDVVSALEEAAKAAPEPKYRDGVDFWDKEAMPPSVWLEQLHEDLETGSQRAWTSIPDWVSDTLKKLGYDGIRDRGGKYHDLEHTVWIPFYPEQVKSALGNRGTFDAANPDITYELRDARREAAKRQVYEATGVPQSIYHEIEARLDRVRARQMQEREARYRLSPAAQATGAAADEAGLVTRAVRGVLDKWAEPVVRRLEKINAVLGAQLRRFEFTMNRERAKGLGHAQGFTNGLRELAARMSQNHRPVDRKQALAAAIAQARASGLAGTEAELVAGLGGMSGDDYLELDLALKNRDGARRDAILEQYGLAEAWAQVEELLADYNRRLRKAGFKFGWLADYFPRKVTDLSGLLAYLESDEAAVKTALDEAIAAVIKERGEGEQGPASREAVVVRAERADEVARGILEGRIPLPDNLRRRALVQVTEGMNRFYASPAEALSHYIEQASEALAAAKLFGEYARHGGPLPQVGEVLLDEIGDLFGLRLGPSVEAYVQGLVATGAIGAAQAGEVGDRQDLLPARLPQRPPRQTHACRGRYRNRATGQLGLAELLAGRTAGGPILKCEQALRVSLLRSFFGRRFRFLGAGRVGLQFVQGGFVFCAPAVQHFNRFGESFTQRGEFVFYLGWDDWINMAGDQAARFHVAQGLHQHFFRNPG
nr:hypothetical protein [Cephaloticoccus primus]